MVAPLVALGLSAAGGAIGRWLGWTKEEKLENALATIASTTQGELPAEVTAALDGDQVMAIKAKGLAIGIRTGRATPPGVVLTPEQARSITPEQVKALFPEKFHPATLRR